MTNPRPRRGRLAVHVAFLAATLATGCNAAFGIHEGKPRPICADPEMIDDMEDGAGDICALNGRQGYWYTVGDGIITDLTPRPGSIFSPTVIPGGRGTSRYAARMTGSGATMWGALMGFNLNGNRAGRATYDASATGGIKFWMKSNAAVSVEFLVPETVLPSDGGACLDTATNVNCDNHFSFLITKPSNDWTEYEVPFAALTQRDSQTSGALTAPPLDGSATWNPKLLLAIQFALAEAVSSSAAFDVWIDDVSFYFCSTATCTPTCHDPDFSVACPATAGGVTGSRAYPASCRPVGTDCAAVATWCADPLIIDDMEDGDRTICDSGKRRGTWNVSGDGTSTDLEPGLGQSFTPTLIQGGRGAGRYAARVAGSGFSSYAGMGFGLNEAGARTYDASTVDGIKFWMKSNVVVSVEFSLPETIAVGTPGGICTSEENCFNDFHFLIGPSTDEWGEYEVPFAALRQYSHFDSLGNEMAGSASWDPSRLVTIHFTSHSSDFDVSVDDIRFYSCPTGACVPTCTGEAPVACAASAGRPAGCFPNGANCFGPPDRTATTGIWGSGPGDVWVVGVSFPSLAGTVLHWNGSQWSPTTIDATPPIWGVWGTGTNDVWAVADHGTVLRWNGSSWSVSPSATSSSPSIPRAKNLSAVWGSSSSDVWVIEFPGTMLHWNGSTWSATTGSTGLLGHVWGSGPNDVWAVGDAGTVIHWDGSTWSSSPSGTRKSLSAVWGVRTDDVWAVGTAGVILHWDGVVWSPVSSGTGQILVSVWGSGPDDVWAVGDVGTIVHWDGAVWSTSASGTSQFLYGVWGSGRNDVWVVGEANTRLHWDGSSWSAQGGL